MPTLTADVGGSVFGELPDTLDQFEGMTHEQIREHKLEARLREFDIEGSKYIFIYMFFVVFQREI